MRPRPEALLDTIAAPATAPGKSALAIVRISGRETRSILAAVAPAAATLEPRRAVLVDLRDAAGETIDQGLAVFFPAPKSFTGEDVAELTVHGSPVVVQRILRALTAAGARLARPGEFTERALHLGKLDLVKAEAIRDLIEARTEAAARASRRRLDGRLSETLGRIRQELVESAAQLAATIDFAEDVGERVDPETLGRLERARQDLTALAATYERGRLLCAGYRVALAGRPNAGKSTLFNALVGSERAIVTEVPGTTRDTVEAMIDVAGVPVALIDTAGLRETRDVVERLGVERARQAAESADAVLYVCDSGQGWTPEDAQAVSTLAGRRVIVVANKIDRAALPLEKPPTVSLEVCGLSAHAGEALRELLSKTLAAGIQTESSSEILGSLRQRDLVDRAARAAGEAIEALERETPPEYAATHIADALDALADLVGETTSEDVLQRIFSTFCIGK